MYVTVKETCKKDQRESTNRYGRVQDRLIHITLPLLIKLIQYDDHRYGELLRVLAIM